MCVCLSYVIQCFVLHALAEECLYLLLYFEDILCFVSHTFGKHIYLCMCPYFLFTAMHCAQVHGPSFLLCPLAFLVATLKRPHGPSLCFVSLTIFSLDLELHLAFSHLTTEKYVTLGLPERHTPISL